MEQDRGPLWPTLLIVAALIALVVFLALCAAPKG